MSAIPTLFEAIPPDLFGPLASPLRELYWEVLVIAYRMDQAAQVDDVAKEALLDRVEEHLRERAVAESGLAQLDDAPEGDEPSDASRERLLAWRLLRRLQRAGWFDYEYRRDLGFVVRFPDHAARLVDFLESVASGQQPEVRGLAYNVKQVLSDEAKRRSDPGFVLYQARDASRAFFKELKILSANIGRYVERSVRQQEVRDLLALHLDEYQRSVVPSFQRFKTRDNVVRFRTDILDRLEDLSVDERFLEGATREIADRQTAAPNEARALAERWLDELRHSFRAVDRLVQEINDRYERYARTTLRKVRYRLFRDETAEAYLAEILRSAGGAPDWDFELWGDLVHAFALRRFDGGSLYTEPTRRPPAEPEPLAAFAVPEDRRRELVGRALDELARRVTRGETFDFAAALLDGRDVFPLEELDPADDRELLRLIHLHAYRDDPEAPYLIEPALSGAPLVWRNGFGFRPGALIRRSGRAG